MEEETNSRDRVMLSNVLDELESGAGERVRQEVERVCLVGCRRPEVGGGSEGGGRGWEEGGGRRGGERLACFPSKDKRSAGEGDWAREGQGLKSV